MGQKDPATLVDKIAGISYNVDRQGAGYERSYRYGISKLNRRAGATARRFALSVILTTGCHEQSNNRQNDHDDFIIRHAITSLSLVRLSGSDHRQYLPAYVVIIA